MPSRTSPEMQGRRQDGLAWITSGTEHWAACNNFTFHLRWHEALFRLDLEEHDRVLEVYDREVRRSADGRVPGRCECGVAPVAPRAGRGRRRRPLAGARRARAARIDDHSLVFVDLHYLMALAAVGDTDGVERFLDSCERFASDEAAPRPR